MALKSDVKAFFEKRSKEEEKEFLESVILGIKRIQDDYYKNSRGYKMCQERIDAKRAEIAALG